MRFYLIFSLLTLASCATQKENPVVESKLESDTTMIIKDEVLTTNDELVEEKREEIVEEMRIIEQDDDMRNINTRRQVQLIENREKKTNLKVIDKSSSLQTNDTTRGWIAFSVPENMKVSKSYSIKVRISKRTSGQNKAILILGNDDAINNPEYNSIATIEDVKVSGEMSADLRGNSDMFSIVSLSTPIQNIDTVSYTEWEWNIVPKNSGESPLKLVIKVKGIDKDIVVFNRNIKIKSNVPVAVEGFFDKYWQWIMTTIIIPIFLYFWNRKRKKTKKS